MNQLYTWATGVAPPRALPLRIKGGRHAGNARLPVFASGR